MKKKGKSYKALEPYQLQKPEKQFGQVPRVFKIMKYPFMAMVWILAIALVVTFARRMHATHHYHLTHKHPLVHRHHGLRH